mmetsp:Transcript_127758/g.355535  ORF Transcript_127758/g.355535 Transcript_127758/m.355535 type:complete len:204 (+) Transcript_127758:167-778(+)
MYVDPPWVREERNLALDPPAPLQLPQAGHGALRAFHALELHKERTTAVRRQEKADGPDGVELQLVHEREELLLIHILIPPSGADPELGVVQQEVQAGMGHEEARPARPQEGGAEERAVGCPLRHGQLLDLRDAVVGIPRGWAQDVAHVTLSAPALEAEADVPRLHGHAAPLPHHVHDVVPPVVRWHLSDGDHPQEVLRPGEPP